MPLLPLSRACFGVRRTAIVVAVLVGASLAGEETRTIVFGGVMASANERAFALSVPGERAVQWVRLGEMFAEHRVEEFDAATQTLVLRRGTAEVRLGLKAEKVVEGMDETTRRNEDVRAKVRDNLRFLAAAAVEFFATTGRERATYADLVGPGKYIEVVRAANGEEYATVEIVRGAARVAVAMPDGTRVETEGSATSGGFRLVRSGEAVEQIAAESGASVERVLELNELAEGGAVRAGRLLRLK